MVKNLALSLRKWHKKNLIGENGGERKINPSANPDFTARKRIVWKEIIDTVYVIMYDQHSNAPAHLEKMQSWICLKISF